MRPFVGAKELIQGHKRYCIWLKDDDGYKEIQEIVKKVDLVREWRSNSERKATAKLADTPHLFAEIRQPNSQYLAVPTISSERREYLPVNFLNKNVIASNQIYIISNATAFHLGLLSSRMHLDWVRAVCGQLETRIRYSAAICYNNFPVPTVSKSDVEKVSIAAMNMLSIRERYPEKSLAYLYDPKTMPEELKKSHMELDVIIDSLYSRKVFSTSEERLNCLFDLYEKITGTYNA